MLTRSFQLCKHRLHKLADTTTSPFYKNARTSNKSAFGTQLRHSNMAGHGMSWYTMFGKHLFERKAPWKTCPSQMAFLVFWRRSFFALPLYKLVNMVLVIESSDPDAIQALTEVAKALKVSFRVEPDDFVVSREERQRRVKALRKFKGGLKKYITGYQPGKHEWYLQWKFS